MAAHYFSVSCLPSLPEGRAQWQQPVHQNDATKEAYQGNDQGKRSQTMENDKGKGTKETECQGYAGHYSAGSSSSPITPAAATARCPSSSSLSQFSSTGGAALPT